VFKTHLFFLCVAVAQQKF